MVYAYQLVLISSISFGGHFARSSLSMFGLYLINDNVITPGGLGVLLGACAIPSMLVPLIVGHYVDRQKGEWSTTLALFLFEICGMTVFLVAAYRASFWLALIAVLLFGVGTSSLTVIQRILVALHLNVWMLASRCTSLTIFMP